ncbi:hypothetical protein GGR54DRAFT_570576 [Hypoxylon sp. NC1633]|nr:hypothetical protein GGR54DRAFT_570576 [Hypoxylon sp. NC1633]
MLEISSDSDLPRLLNTPSKQVKWAKKLVAKHLGSAVKRVDKPPMQGMFSRTQFLTLAYGREAAFQFRTAPLDLDAFSIAKEALDVLVPDALWRTRRFLTGVFGLPPSLACMARCGFMRLPVRGAEGRIAINRSLGCIFSKGDLADSSEEAINGRI